MVERGIRGGISTCIKRHTVSSPDNTLLYLDANNLYGWAMSQPLPTGGFKFIDPTTDIMTILSRMTGRDIGYIFEVDLHYPQHVHDKLSDLPPAPENVTVTEDMLSQIQKKLYDSHYSNKTFKTTRKLIPSLLDKTNYIIHETVLKQCIELGLVVRKVHSIVSFEQEPWLKSYIDFNTSKRASARNKFEKDLFKLMNNAVYGKTMENVRNHRKFDVRPKNKTLLKHFRRPNFFGVIDIGDDNVLVESKIVEVELDKPIYVGFCVLELSKYLMYNFHYNFSRIKFPGVELCYMDTDSFIYDIPMSESRVFAVMKENEDEFDFSEYPKDHMCYSAKNAKVCLLLFHFHRFRVRRLTSVARKTLTMDSFISDIDCPILHLLTNNLSTIPGHWQVQR